MFGERALIAALSALVGASVTWGVLITKVAALDRRVSAIEQQIGRELTRLSNQLAYLNGHLSARGLAQAPREEADDGGV